MDEIKPGSYIYTNNPPVEIKGLMTLRDYFAAKAMQGLIERGFTEFGNSASAYANLAFEYADAMLKERMEKNT